MGHCNLNLTQPLVIKDRSGAMTLTRLIPISYGPFSS